MSENVPKANLIPVSSKPKQAKKAKTCFCVKRQALSSCFNSKKPMLSKLATPYVELFTCFKNLRSLSLFYRSGRSNLSILKWNARVLRTGSGRNGPAHGSEPLSSPAPVGQLQSAGIWRVVAGKMYTRALDTFHLNRPEPVLFGWPERTNGKRPKKPLKCSHNFIFLSLEKTKHILTF